MKTRIQIAVLFIVLSAVFILSGCTTAQAVPKAKFHFNPRTGDLEISNPKDMEVQNVVVTIAQTNGMRLVQFQIGSYKTVNNPDVIEKSGLGSAAMINAGADAGVRYFTLGLQAAAQAVGVPKLPAPPLK
jgi:hypothetical protein